MPVTVFKDASYNLSGLIFKIRHGEIALPDIQRPFVWSNAKVRDLFDSMYKGFPVGYLLFWSTSADPTARQIGTDEKQTVPSLLIVDGQQRLTSLFAVITAKPVVRKDYSEEHISIAFRPTDQRFEVTDIAVKSDPEFIPDISEVFRGAFLSFVNAFLDRLEQHRGQPLGNEERDRLHEAIDQLKDLQNYPFQAIELDKSVDEEHVAEVFVRINSEGVQLKHADFILTLMSVFWEKGRRELEEFSRAAKTPSTGPASPFNHFIQPSPDQLLRTSVGLAFRRGRLQSVYQILRGKDLDTGQFSPERRERQFVTMQAAHDATLDLTNWHEYLKCLKQAGFLSSRMVSSETAFTYVYVLWLIGRRDYGVDRKVLRSVIARWWFMAHTTGRYTGSSETQIEADLNRLREIPAGDGERFCSTLDRIVGDTFTSDYWRITLPNRLDTSAAKSPPLSAYWAALNLLDAELLFSKLKVASMLDPAITPIRQIERHHLFPKGHLATLGVTDRTQQNAIANMSFVDWADNAAAAAKAPEEYWQVMTAHMSAVQIERHRYWHALPIGWEQLPYEEFCVKRRELIARVIEDGYKQLRAEEPAPPQTSGVRDLAADGESNVLEFKSSARWNLHTAAKDSKIEHVIVKTVAGFMNAEGGTLLIGVGDDGSIIGLDNDYSTLSKGNRDGFELWLTGLVSAQISGPSATLIRTTFESVDGKDVCRVAVAAAARPVFTESVGGNPGHVEFWVRLGNQTRQLHGSEMIDYQKDHWG